MCRSSQPRGRLLVADSHIRRQCWRTSRDDGTQDSWPQAQFPVLASAHALAPLRLRGGKLRDEARTGGKLADVIGPSGIFLRQQGMVTSDSHQRGEADKHQRKRFRRKERAAQVADANRMRKLKKKHEVGRELDKEDTGEIIYAARGDTLREQQARADDPYAWLEKQLEVAEKTEGEVPTTQDALKRHVEEDNGAWRLVSAVFTSAR